MSCDLLTGGVSKGCDPNNLGGLQKIYITDFSNLSAVTATTGNITAITMAGSPVSKFYEFEFNRNTSQFSEEQPQNIENGSSYYLQTVDLVIPKRDVTKRNVIKLLAQRDVALIVKDANGTYWAVGFGSASSGVSGTGAQLTEHTGGTGLAKADGSKYILKFTAEIGEPAETITASVVTGVVTES